MRRKRVVMTVMWDGVRKEPQLAAMRDFHLIAKKRWCLVCTSMADRPVFGWGERQAMIERGRLLCRNDRPSQLVIKGKNGRIQREYTYGADPRTTKG